MTSSSAEGQQGDDPRVVVVGPNQMAFASAGGDYNAEIAAQAWSETLAFLSQNLKLRSAKP